VQGMGQVLAAIAVRRRAFGRAIRGENVQA
jgi:hypothetical protein